MSAGFAGSASQDDRRRRRLLTDPSGEDAGSVRFAPGRPESTRNHRFPLRHIVQYKAWRVWLTAALLFLLGGAVVYLSWLAERSDLGPGFARLCNPHSGTLFPALCGGLLLMGSQLTCLIGWARGRSLTDFGGRFRVWRTIGGFLFLLSAGVVLQGDRALSETLDWAGVARPWSLDALDWLVPVGTISLFLVWCSDRELRVSTIARTHLWLGFLTISGACAVAAMESTNTPILVQRALLLAGLWLYGMSLLWFARHVLYFSAEPAALPKRDLFGWLKFLRLPRRARSSDDALEGDDSRGETDDETGTRKTRTRRKKPAARKPATAKPAITRSTDPDDGDFETSPVVVAAAATRFDAPAPPVSREPQYVSEDDREDSDDDFEGDPELRERAELMQMMIDEGEPIDEGLYKGLSKKQRRLLKRKQRELERHAA